jgi:hypothetical protein
MDDVLSPHQIRDAMAEAMCPEAWAEFHEGNGVCTNAAGWNCIQSTEWASRAYRRLFELGFVPEPPEPDAVKVAGGRDGGSDG